MIPTRQQRKPNSTMIARMLIMIPQPIHILIPPLTRRDLTTIRPQLPLRLPLTQAQPPTLNTQHRRQLRRRVKITLPMRHMVLQTIRLLVGFHAAWFGAFEGLGEEEGCGGTGEGR